MTLDDIPISAVGRKVRLTNETYDIEGLITRLQASADPLNAVTEGSDSPIQTYIGPPSYSISLIVGASEVDFENLDPNTQIDLV